MRDKVIFWGTVPYCTSSSWTFVVGWKPVTSQAIKRLLWRLRSPSLDQMNECYIVEHSSVSSELQFVQIPPGLKLISPTHFLATVAALKGAALLATTLRADGFTNAG